MILLVTQDGEGTLEVYMLRETKINGFMKTLNGGHMNMRQRINFLEYKKIQTKRIQNNGNLENGNCVGEDNGSHGRNLSLRNFYS